MAQTINVPGMGEVDFPDNMSDAQIEAAIKANLPKPNPIPNPLMETGKVLAKSLYGGLTSIPRLVAEGGDYLEKQFPTPEWSKVPVPGGKIARAADTAILEAIQPQSEPGKALANIGEAAVGAVFGPGGLTKVGGAAAAVAPKGMAALKALLPAAKQSALIGASTGVGSEAAARLVSDDPLVRLLGGLAGGGAMAIGQAITPNAPGMIRTATKGLTPEEFAEAAAREATLKANNMPYLASQVLGENSSLADIVQLASGNPHARQTILRATSDVVPKTREALNVWMAQHLMPSGTNARGVKLDVQQAAAEAKKAGMGRANAAYEAKMPPPGGVYDPGRMQSVADDLTALANSERYGPKSEGGSAILRFVAEKFPKTKAVEPTPTGILDAEGAMGTVAGSGKPAGYAPMQQYHLNNLYKDLNALKQVEGWKGLPVGDIRKVVQGYTPEFQAAREARRQVIATEVNPLGESLAGQIARMGGGVKEGVYTPTADIGKMVFTGNKDQSMDIVQLGKDIGNDQVSKIFREHLVATWMAAEKQGGREAPAHFVKELAGNEAMRQNLAAGLTVAAKDAKVNPAALKRGFEELNHALATYKDLRVASGVSPVSTSFEAGKSILGTAIAFMSRMSRFITEGATAKTFQEIADMVTAPDGLKQIEAIARTRDPKLKTALIRSLLVVPTQQNPAETNPPGITTE